MDMAMLIVTAGTTITVAVDSAQSGMACASPYGWGSQVGGPQDAGVYLDARAANEASSEPLFPALHRLFVVVVGIVDEALARRDGTRVQVDANTVDHKRRLDLMSRRHSDVPVLDSPMLRLWLLDELPLNVASLHPPSCLDPASFC